MTAYGAPGVDLHTPTGEYVYPKGPEHYGRGLILCEATGETTQWGVFASSLRLHNGRTLWICEHCATDEEANASRSLASLNADRKAAAR